MSLSQNSVALAAVALLAAGGCDLRCNGPTTILPVKIKYGGRAVAIATNPGDDKAALVVSESGGIFQTRNYGSPWFQITGTTTFWFSDVHYYDYNPEILIATAFQDTKVASSGGVWRTAGGGPWTHVAIAPPDPTKPIEAYGIAVEPSDPPRIWVGTSQGLISSTDEGVNWTFQPAQANFPQIAVLCVLAPSPNHVRVITKQGFRASDDGGATWTQATEGKLPYGGGATHNQLACSPANDEVVYWCGYVTLDSGEAGVVLTRSMDGGVTWETVMTRRGQSRDPFLRATPRALSSAAKYQLYFGDGVSYVARVDINKNDEKIGSWQQLSIDHWDCSDIGFKDDGFTPWLLAGDGGLQTTTDKGAHWKMGGGNGADGYVALQISDATGQVHDKDHQSDLYFGTQDNQFWASPDNGTTWPNADGVEGMHLEVRAEHSATENDNKVTYMHTPPFREIITSRQLLSSVPMTVPPVTPFPVPVRRIGDQTYVTRIPSADLSNTEEIWITHNNGALWFDHVQAPGFAYVRDRTKLVNGATGPILSYADYFTDINGLVIMRAFDLDGNGTPFFSPVSGFGDLASARAKAPSSGNPPVWDALYAVDPFGPDHILVVDQLGSVVRVTWDGGMTWAVDNNLKTVITKRGTYKFQESPQYGAMQITTIAFDPRQRGRILVGTVQAGVVYSCNFGQTWMRLEDSENIPNVSSFYFTPEGWTLVSSYGRGLWRLTPTCPTSTDQPPSYERRTSAPIFETGGATFPLSALMAESKFSFVVARGGDITGYQTDKMGKQVESVGITSGSLEGLTLSGEKAPAVVPVQTAAARPPSDPKLAELMKQGFQIKGICLEGKLFKGYVLSKNEIAATDLPKPRVPGPMVLVSLSRDAARRVATITGVRFEPAKALLLLLNDQVLPAAATVGRDGRFQFDVPVPPAPGHYVLTVRQTGAHGLSASAFYEIMQSD